MQAMQAMQTKKIKKLSPLRKVVLGESTHPRPLPARRDGSALHRQNTVYLPVGIVALLPSLFKGGAGGG